MLEQEPQYSHIHISARRAWQRHLIAAVTKSEATPQSIGAAILAIPAKYSNVSVSEALSFARHVGTVLEKHTDAATSGEVIVQDMEDVGPGAL